MKSIDIYEGDLRILDKMIDKGMYDTYADIISDFLTKINLVKKD